MTASSDKWGEGTGVGHGDSMGCLLEEKVVLNPKLKPHALRKKRKWRLDAKFPLQSSVHPLPLMRAHSFPLSPLHNPPLSPCAWGSENPRISDTKNEFPGEPQVPAFTLKTNTLSPLCTLVPQAFHLSQILVPDPVEMWSCLLSKGINSFTYISQWADLL